MTETSVPSMLHGPAMDAIRVEDLNVIYKVYEDSLTTTRMQFTKGFRTRTSTRVHAVKNMSFQVGVGEAIGIIGANGSGKSTLLRAIAGLQSRASGRVLVRGEARLLGVGASLKPALSGYRNVMLGGLAMGISRREIEDQLDEVANFSGLGTAMSRPMATFSSGMKARLAFSIATLRVPDILLIDEALAVGDKDFREKSLERINQIRQNAGTVVMVTHSLGEIRASCSRAIWMDRGTLMANGDVEDVIEQYERH